MKWSSESTEIHHNNIYDNTVFGINATDNEGYVINATHNWWGDTTGPYHPAKNPSGKGDEVTDDVIFVPWLKEPYEEKPPPEPLNTVYVYAAAPDGGNGSKEHPFNRIQDAIDAAAEGATIYVWEGVYYENVDVEKTVSLIGNGSESTTINGISGNDDVVDIKVDWCNISGFRITGSGKDRLSTSGIEIRSDNNNIFNNNCSNNYYGIQLDFSSDCTLRNNTFSDNSKSGISISYSNYRNR